jgi:hypothetical protein
MGYPPRGGPAAERGPGTGTCLARDLRTDHLQGSDDGSLRVWNLRTRVQMALLAFDSLHALAITSAGDLLVGVHDDLAAFRRQPLHRLSAKPRTLWRKAPQTRWVRLDLRQPFHCPLLVAPTPLHANRFVTRATCGSLTDASTQATPSEFSRGGGNLSGLPDH